MSAIPVTREQVRAYVERGVQNAWYPVVPSWRLQDTPLGITRLSEHVVLWRDRSGQVHALADRCPHRGARLSLGWNLGDRLACWYHGVEIDCAGRVCDVPAVDQSPMKEERAVRSYPALEAHGAVFLWFGDALHRTPAVLEFPEQLTSPDWGNMLTTAYWKCNYQYAIDNVMDPMHGQYLHALSHSMAEGDKKAEMRTRATPKGMVFEKIGQRDVNFDWVEWIENGGFCMRLSIPYRKRYGPGGPFYIVGFCTPVDTEHTLVFFWRCRQVAGWQRDVWKFLYKNRLEGLHWHVLEQDRLVLENMAPQARQDEFLYQHDAGLARVRRRMEEIGREHLAQLASAPQVTAA